MRLEFDKIYLSKEEKQALDAVANSDILIEKRNKDAFQRLSDLELVDIKPATEYKSDFGAYAKRAHLNDYGRAYSSYSSAMEKAKKESFWNNAFFTFVGVALTFIFDRLDCIISFFQMLLDKR